MTSVATPAPATPEAIPCAAMAGVSSCAGALLAGVAAGPPICLPSKTTRPCDAGHSPMIVRSVVVLPAPLRPSSIVTASAGTSKSTPCRM